MGDSNGQPKHYIVIKPQHQLEMLKHTIELSIERSLWVCHKHLLVFEYLKDILHGNKKNATYLESTAPSTEWPPLHH